MKLPPKPQPWEGPIEWDLWGRACAKAALEAAAKECDNNARLYPSLGTGWESSRECTIAIRNIKIED